MVALDYPQLKKLRGDAQNIFQASLKAVDPYQAVKNVMSVRGSRLLIRKPGGSTQTFSFEEFDRIIVVGAGKATAPMAKAIETLLGRRITLGLINVKYGFTEKLKYIETVEASHPISDESGVQGTKRMIEILQQAGKKDLVISLISGGGSALLPYPAGKISLEEKQSLTQMLLNCGASIDEINMIRKSISGTKGGN